MTTKITSIFTRRLSLLLVLSIGIVQIGLCQTPYSKELLAKAQKGDPKAQYEIGLAIGLGNSIEENVETGVKWIEKSAIQGYLDAVITMGDLCCEKNDYLKAAKWYKIASDNGDSHSMFRIATFYGIGRGVEKDKRKSAFYMQQAAEKGHIRAMNMLGMYYAEGFGIERNWEKCFYWTQKAANNGHEGACYFLARDYAKGTPAVTPDPTKAINYMNIATEKEYPLALLSVGLSFYEGNFWSNGVKDYAKAVELLTKFIDPSRTMDVGNEQLGIVYLTLSKCYRFGRGTKADIKKANLYYDKARLLGVTDDNIDQLIKNLQLNQL